MPNMLEPKASAAALSALTWGQQTGHDPEEIWLDSPFPPFSVLRPACFQADALDKPCHKVPGHSPDFVTLSQQV